MSFNLRIFIDPDKDVVPKQIAARLAGGYACHCVVSSAVMRAVQATPGRFRRWSLFRAHTMYSYTFIKVRDRNGKVREYSASLPKNVHQQRHNYDYEQPVEAVGAELVFKQVSI